MSKIRLAAFLSVIVFIASLIFVGCGETAPEWNGNISVTVIDSECYELEYGNYDYSADGKTVYIPKGSDVTLRLTMREPYFAESINFPRSVIEEDGPVTTNIRLFGVKYSTRVRIECGKRESVISYDPNGGTLFSGNAVATESYSLIHHARPNTSRGTDIMSRPGYTLIGWNTKPDGSGEHIGLGSRMTVGPNSFNRLYAEWLAQSPADDFDYIEYPNNAVIRKYLGHAEKVVIPEKINGRPVTGILGGAFSSCSVKTAVFPLGLKNVYAGAFTDSAIEELYMFDNVSRIGDDCFVGCDNLRTLHINAVEQPRYPDLDRHSVYADKVDLMIKHKDKKKIVVFGGSGSYYSVNACRLAEEFPDYEVVNVAINAYFNTEAQVRAIADCLGEGDIFLHVPEMMSGYQYMDRTDMDDERYLMCLELNWDLLAKIDLTRVSGTFDAFYKFNEGRKTKRGKSYSDYTTYMDSRGDYNAQRFPYGKDEPITNEGGIRPELINAASMSRLNGLYDFIESRGAKILIAYAAVNKHSLPDFWERDAAAFEAEFSKYMTRPIINDIGSVVYNGSVFADSDWHLCKESSIEHTATLARAIRKYI